MHPGAKRRLSGSQTASDLAEPHPDPQGATDALQALEEEADEEDLGAAGA